MQAFWDGLQQTERFTPISTINVPTPTRRFRLEEGQIYYLGAGWFVTYEERLFGFDGHEHIEYGVAGEYAFDIAYFADENYAASHFLFPSGKYQFGNMACSPPLVVIKAIRIGDTFRDVSRLLRKELDLETYYHEGETRQLRNGEFCQTNLFIHYDQYQFLFFGNGKLARLNGFVYTLPG